MTNSFCLSGLIEKRAELAGDIRLAEERLEQLRSDILHLDATIRIMDPAYQVDAIVPKVRRPRREWFGNGELLRLILETLRKAPEPPGLTHVISHLKAVLKRGTSASRERRYRG